MLSTHSLRAGSVWATRTRARRLDQRSPARVAAIGTISGVTWTYPSCHSKERIELAGCQGHSWLLSRGVLESNRFILACELHAIPPLLHRYQPPYFVPAELQKIQAGRAPSTNEWRGHRKRRPECLACFTVGANCLMSRKVTEGREFRASWRYVCSGHHSQLRP